MDSKFGGWLRRINCSRGMQKSLSSAGSVDSRVSFEYTRKTISLSAPNLRNCSKAKEFRLKSKKGSEVMALVAKLRRKIIQMVAVLPGS